MASSIKLKAREKEGKVTVKTLINHPMETGQRKDKDGNTIPAHYIETVTVMADDQEIMTANWGASISKNPYMSVAYAGSKGQKITLSWTDNQGESDSAETEVK